MRIQSNLASTIAMAFDECIENPVRPMNISHRSIARTVRWLERCKAEMDRLKSPAGYHQPPPDCSSASTRDRTFEDLRIEHMQADR